MINTNKRYLFIALSIAVVLLILMMQFAFMFKDTKAYADDLSTDNIINFNQLVKSDYIQRQENGATPHGIWYTNSLVTGHIYYCKFNVTMISNNSPMKVFFSNYSITDLQTFISLNEGVNTYYGYGVCNINNPYLTTWCNNSFSWDSMMLVDLTLAFGQGSEPSLQICQSLFTSDYYNYTTGTPISINATQVYNMGYASGYNDGLSEVNLNNSVINFNQQVPNDNISGTANSLRQEFDNITLLPLHKYYISIDKVANPFLLQVLRGLDLNLSGDQTSASGIFTIPNDPNIHLVLISTSENLAQYKNFVVIDLTQAFGDNVGFVTLDYLHSKFTSAFYPYNTGTPMLVNAVDAYNQGLNAYASSTKFTILTSDFVNSVYAVNLDDEYKGYGVSQGVSWSILERDSTTVTLKSLTSLAPTSTICFPFDYTVKAGTQVTVEGNIYDGAYNQVHDVGIGYYANGGMQPLGIMTGYSGSPVRYKNNVITFTMPVDLDRIYIYCGLDGQDIYLRDFKVSYYVTNLEMLKDTSYTKGFNEAKKQFDEYYSPSGLGYKAIYNKGYYAYPTEDHFTFQKLIYSVIDVPVQAFTNLFDYDILGVNMKTFYLSLFTLAVIVTIIRLVL